jgi:hypothetical protein
LSHTEKGNVAWRVCDNQSRDNNDIDDQSHKFHTEGEQQAPEAKVWQLESELKNTLPRKKVDWLTQNCQYAG